MQMRYVGKGVYHSGPGGIERPGDFGWRIDGPQLDQNGRPTGVPGGIQIALHCPRTGVCFQWVRENVPAGDADGRRYWRWDGNWERPTITPSIGCDDLNTRCGQHMTISAGEISGNTPGAWVRRPRRDDAS
jgi:hypothetical protein